MTDKDTVKFTVPSDDKENMRRILRNVYEALTACLLYTSDAADD